MKRVLIAAITLTLLAQAGLSATDQWPQFRGPRAGVVDDDPALPDTWSETENVAWKVNIPGMGWGSPIVWDDHIFLASSISAGKEPAPTPGLYDELGGIKTTSEHRWVLYDIDVKTGKIRWERDLGQMVPAHPKHLKNSFASETPATDGERVYVYFGAIGLVAALDLNGKVLWTKDIGTYETHRPDAEYGTGASPIVYKDRLIIINDNLTESFIAAFDTKSGKELWRVKRDGEHGNWATPFIWENDRRVEIVTMGGNRHRSYDLNGKLLWDMEGDHAAPTPFAGHGLLFMNGGGPGSFPRPMWAIRPGAHGDITLKPDQTSNDYVAWYNPTLGTYVTSAQLYGDYYYTLLDRGFLLCHDARTGKEMYGRKRIAQVSGFTASPWAYNGKLFMLSEDGDTFVVQAGPEYKLLGKNSLNEMVMATPAVARGSLYIRTQSKLYRITRGQP
jgi:outer membrane protein assembly factor BamB